MHRRSLKRGALAGRLLNAGHHGVDFVLAYAEVVLARAYAPDVIGATVFRPFLEVGNALFVSMAGNCNAIAILGPVKLVIVQVDCNLAVTIPRFTDGRCTPTTCSEKLMEHHRVDNRIDRTRYDNII